VVFDIDGDPGWAGVVDLFDHDIPPTYRVSTEKGLHLYYATRQNYKSRNRLFPDLDVKGSGFVLGAGSIHPSGARYVANDLEVAHLPYRSRSGWWRWAYVEWATQSAPR
jgi:hypothetical protein